MNDDLKRALDRLKSTNKDDDKEDKKKIDISKVVQDTPQHQNKYK